jgi:hypothetical protein
MAAKVHFPYHPTISASTMGECATQRFADEAFDASFPDFFVIGSNGGGEAIAFDMRASKPWPFVSFDMMNIELAESVVTVASDFASFLELVGVSPGD